MREFVDVLGAMPCQLESIAMCLARCHQAGREAIARRKLPAILPEDARREAGGIPTIVPFRSAPLCKSIFAPDTDTVDTHAA